VEKTQGDAVHSIGKGNRDASRSVPGEDTGSDGEEQLPTVLGKLEVLRDRRRDRQAVSVAERGGAAGIRSAVDEQGDAGDRRAGVRRAGRRGVRWLAREGAQVRDVGADVYERNGNGDQAGVGGIGEGRGWRGRVAGR
jgi:hypothetical protein